MFLLDLFVIGAILNFESGMDAVEKFQLSMVMAMNDPPPVLRPSSGLVT